MVPPVTYVESDEVNSNYNKYSKMERGQLKFLCGQTQWAVIRVVLMIICAFQSLSLSITDTTWEKGMTSGSGKNGGTEGQTAMGTSNQSFDLEGDNASSDANVGNDKANEDNRESEDMCQYIVKEDDYMYGSKYINKSWDTAPIVIPEAKVVFFAIAKVGCTTWKELFWKIAGYGNWESQDWKKKLLHNPCTNGLSLKRIQ